MEEQNTNEETNATSPRRVSRVERLRRVSDLSVGQLSLRELHQELQRRIRGLQEQKKELLDKLEEIDRELEEMIHMAPGVVVDVPGKAPNGLRGRKRHRNEKPLADMLIEVLEDRSLTTREASEAAIAAGYRTTSKNFVNSVGVALHRDERFVKDGGRWVLKAD